MTVARLFARAATVRPVADRVAVALAHDYLTQRGGAERVVLSLCKAFPGSPLHTALYSPGDTFPEFATVDVRPSGLNRAALLRKHHRLALPLLAPVFGRTEIAAELVVCSSSGWAHGVQTTGRKLVYCYSPARWLYQEDRYVGRSPIRRLALLPLRRRLVAWDRRAALSADVYVTSSRAVRERIRDTYGLDAEIVPPPPTLAPAGGLRPLAQLEAGFLLCVSRLLPYKNVDKVAEAFGRSELRNARLVIVGSGPESARISRHSPPNVLFASRVTDEELRWLYHASAGVVAASYEDYGLTPLEAASLGKPAAVLRWGGFLDTVVEGETGLFFDRPEPAAIADACTRLLNASWSADALRAHAARFAEERFVERIRDIAEAALG